MTPCPHCGHDPAAARRFLLAVCDRLLLCAEILARLAERKAIKAAWLKVKGGAA